MVQTLAAIGDQNNTKIGDVTGPWDDWGNSGLSSGFCFEACPLDIAYSTFHNKNPSPT